MRSTKTLKKCLLNVKNIVQYIKYIVILIIIWSFLWDLLVTF